MPSTTQGPPTSGARADEHHRRNLKLLGDLWLHKQMITVLAATLWGKYTSDGVKCSFGLWKAQWSAASSCKSCSGTERKEARKTSSLQVEANAAACCRYLEPQCHETWLAIMLQTKKSIDCHFIMKNEEVNLKAVPCTATGTKGWNLLRTSRLSPEGLFNRNATVGT